MNEHDQKMPRTVELASSLLWFSAAIALLHIIAARLDWLPYRTSEDSVIPNLISTAFIALCAAQIRAGRNWARWLALVAIALGSGVYVVAILFLRQGIRSLPAFLLYVASVQFLLQVASVVLAFVPRSNGWFRATASQDTV